MFTIKNFFQPYDHVKIEIMEKLPKEEKLLP